jgi:hypothetical protein
MYTKYDFERQDTFKLDQAIKSKHLKCNVKKEQWFKTMRECVSKTWLCVLEGM